MVYTSTRGTRDYDNRLHYSLYGGVEFLPDRLPPLRELLPLVAIPAAAIALFAAVMSFHVPSLRPAGHPPATTAPGGNSAAATTARGGSAAAAPPAGSTPASAGAARPAVTVSPAVLPAMLTPLGSDNGQGIIGGKGSGPAVSTTPSPAPDTGSTSTPAPSAPTTTVSTSLVQTSATVSTQPLQASVSADVSPTGTSVSIDPAL